MSIIREHIGIGVQLIATLIYFDIPARLSGEPELFDEDEIVLRLHDDGESGRLFKLKAW